ncbi:putative transmembrane efflux protein [[Actinomadura] parvosata subsp. kistnae]|nr:putative transmembrane efflux protein [Actinomadura parvosata subsp. kistnae]
MPMIVLCLVQLMLVLDDTVVSVALPSIRDELGFSASELPWVVNAYFLAFGGLLLLCGRMADLLGRRRVFLIGVALFGVASLACGLAQELWQLVIGRFVQGSGSAMASPPAMSMITLLYPEARERARALGIWGGIAALGGTSGLVLSGALTDLASWRWIFLINLPVVAVTLALLPRLIPESRAPGRRRLDVPGATLITGAAVSLVYGLLRAGEEGWGDHLVIGAVVLSAALAVAFLAAESRAGRLWFRARSWRRGPVRSPTARPCCSRWRCTRWRSC